MCLTVSKVNYAVKLTYFSTDAISFISFHFSSDILASVVIIVKKNSPEFSGDALIEPGTF